MTQHDDIHEAGGYSRRRFLGTLGVGAVAVGTGGAVRLGTAHAAAPAAAPTRHVAPALTTHFGRMFERLPGVRRPRKPRSRSRARRARLARRGPRRARRAQPRPGAADHRPLALGAQPRQPDAHRRHDLHGPVHGPRHDLRRRLTARQAGVAERAAATAARRPSTSTRSTAPARSASPQLYDPADRAKLKVGVGGLFEDVPRHGRRHRDHRRPPQRREHDHLRAAVRPSCSFHNRVVDRSARRRDRRRPRAVHRRRAG